MLKSISVKTFSELFHFLKYSYLFFFFLSYFFPVYSIILAAFYLLCAMRINKSGAKRLFAVLLFFTALGTLAAVRDGQLKVRKNINHITENQDFRSKFISVTESKTSSNIVLALVTGHRKFTPKEKIAFVNSGTMHIVAISAFHIGVLLYVINLLYRFLFVFLHSVKSHYLNLIVLFIKMISLLFYLYMTGFSVPTVRASLFIFLFDFGMTFGVRPNVYYVFLLSLIVTAALIPGSLVGMSFLMSAMAVLAIVAFWRFLPDNEILKVLLLSVLINVVLLPLTVKMSGVYSLLSPITNLAVIPIVGVLIVFTTISQASYFISEDLFAFFIEISDLIASVVEVNIKFFATFSEMIALAAVSRSGFVVFLTFVVFISLLFLSGKYRYLFLGVYFIFLSLFFVDTDSKIRVKNIHSLGGKVKCVNLGFGEGIIVEQKRYFFRKSAVSEEDRVLLYLEKELAECGVTKVKSFHLRHKMKRRLWKRLKTRSRFQDSKEYLIEDPAN